MLHALIASICVCLPADLPPHDQNAVFRAVTTEGVAGVKLPEPTFRDGQTADEQKAALAKVAGSARGADEMLQDSVSAPHKLFMADVKADDATVRTGELVYVLRGAGLNAIDPEQAFREFRGESIDVANMRVKVQLLANEDLKEAKADATAANEWLIHSTGRLLDRLSVESTDRVEATRSEDSVIFASRADPAFGPDAPFPNRWATITLKSTGDVLGDARPYAGGIGYAKMTRLKDQPEAVLVEFHFAYVEPRAWFDGAPILRSKFGLISQDQVRRIRRELLKAKR